MCHTTSTKGRGTAACPHLGKHSLGVSLAGGSVHPCVCVTRYYGPGMQASVRVTV